MLANDTPIPRKLQTRGLRDWHRRPLAADMKDARGMMYPKRADPDTAWRKKAYIEINPHNAWTNIVLDLDDFGAYYDFLAENEKYPQANWETTNNRNGHIQAGWILKTPVHRNALSSLKPQIKLADVAARMSYAMGADSSYGGLIARNPCFKHETLTTEWSDSRKKGYTLDQLGHLPDVPKAKLYEVPIGRNVSLFRSVLRFAANSRNQDADLYETALMLNHNFNYPLPLNEIRSIAKSVKRITTRPTWKSKTFSEWQSGNGKRSGAKRRLKTQSRDRNIWLHYEQGILTNCAIAEMFGVSEGTVRHIVKREKANVI